MSCPEELKQLVIDDLGDITFIEACKLYVRASTTGRTCDCKGKCFTRQGPCNDEQKINSIALTLVNEAISSMEKNIIDSNTR